jgi:hypothetical protein
MAARRRPFAAAVALLALLSGAAPRPAAPRAALAAGPAPVIESVTPLEGAAAGGTVLTVTGTGFVPPLEVTIGGVVAAVVELVSETELRATTPPGAKGPAAIVVANTADPRSDSAPFAGFAYLAHPAYAFVPRALGSDTGGNPGGKDLSLVDLANRREVASLDLNPANPDLPGDDDWRPTQVLLSADGSRAYVATAGTPGTRDSERIFVLRVARLTGEEPGDPVTAVLDTDGNPYQLAFSDDGTRLYAADAGSWKGSATVLPNGTFRGWSLADPAIPVAMAGTPGTVGILPVLNPGAASLRGWGTNSADPGAIHRQGKRSVVTNAGSKSLSVVDLDTLGVTATVALDAGEGVVTATSSTVSPYDTDLVLAQTLDVVGQVTRYAVYRVSTGTLTERGTVATPMLFFPVLPRPELQGRLAWPHPDGRSLVAVPSGEGSVAAWSPVTGSAPNRTAVGGDASPTALGWNDATGHFYARRSDGGWAVLAFPVPAPASSAPALVKQQVDTTGIGSFRVFGTGAEMAATGTARAVVIDGAPASPTAHEIVGSIPLALDPHGGPLFPVPSASAGAARTYLEPRPGAEGPLVLGPEPGTEVCAGDDPPVVSFDPAGPDGGRYEIEAGSQYDFTVGIGARRARAAVPAGETEATFPAGAWRRVLRAAAGSVPRPVFVRVNEVLHGGERRYGEAVALVVCGPEACVPTGPANGFEGDGDRSPIFTMDVVVEGERAWVEIGGPDGVGDRPWARAALKAPRDGSGLEAAFATGRWRHLVARARREGGGTTATLTWRAVCRDLLGREIRSGERTVVVP